MLVMRCEALESPLVISFAMSSLFQKMISQSQALVIHRRLRLGVRKFHRARSQDCSIALSSTIHVLECVPIEPSLAKKSLYLSVLPPQVHENFLAAIFPP